MFDELILPANAKQPGNSADAKLLSTPISESSTVGQILIDEAWRAKADWAAKTLADKQKSAEISSRYMEPGVIASVNHGECGILPGTVLSSEVLMARSGLQPSLACRWTKIEPSQMVLPLPGEQVRRYRWSWERPAESLADARDKVLQILLRDNKLRSWTETTIQPLMKDFELAAATRGLDENEVRNTYKELKRVLESSLAAKLYPVEKLACEILRNAAKPTSIDQGQHPTCNVTSYECRLYAIAPSKAAKLVADIATTGEYRCHDGSRIRPRAIQPDEEARCTVPYDGQRNFASQLFQVTAINIYWNRQTTLPDGRRPGSGMIAYCQAPGRATDSEYLLDCSQDPPKRFVLNFRSNTENSPFLNLPAISEINKQITGKDSVDFAIERDYPKSNRHGILGVETIAEFRATLIRLKTEKKFPVLLGVDAALKPFGQGADVDSGTAPHLVTITDYDEISNRVSVDNQWGSHNDFSYAPGAQPPIPLTELFAAMDRKFPSKELTDYARRQLADTTWKDVRDIGLGAASSRLAMRACFGSYSPLLVQDALLIGNRARIPGSLSLWEATQTPRGGIALRGAMALSTLALAYTLNDVHSAFKRSPEEGGGKLFRAGTNLVALEAGSTLSIRAATACGLKWAPGKYAVGLACGVAFATGVDRSMGEIFEVIGRVCANETRALVTNRR